MKRIKSIVLGLIIAGLVAIPAYQIIGSSNGAQQKSTKNQLPKITVEPLAKTGSDGSFSNLSAGDIKPTIPGKAIVYKVKTPIITKENVSAQALKLGISGTARETSVDISVKSPTGDYIVDKESGADVYMTKDFELQAFPLKTLLSDETYRKLATDFLNEKGLMKGDAVFKGVNRGNTYTSGDGSINQAPFMIEIGFSRKALNGIEWAGVGPRITVQFGENGKIIGADSVWREVEPFKEYPVISFSEALDKVKAGNAAIYNVGLNDSGVVEGAKLVYMSDPVGSHQEYVIPYYELKGKSGSGKSFIAYTRAIPENLITEAPASHSSAPQGSKRK